MEKDRDQMTPDDPEDRAKLQGDRGQGTAGTGSDRLWGDDAPEYAADAAPGESPGD